MNLHGEYIQNRYEAMQRDQERKIQPKKYYSNARINKYLDQEERNDRYFDYIIKHSQEKS